MKYLKVFLLSISLLIRYSFYAQTDSSNKGTIKVTKEGTEHYIKAFASFKMFKPSNTHYNYSYKAFVQSAFSIEGASAPRPTVFNFNEEFSYTSYFRNNPGLRAISLGKKKLDTVQIEVEILSTGAYKYYHTKPLRTIYSNTKNGNNAKYTFSELQIATMLVFEGINKWQPAYYYIPVKKKKGKKSKPKKENLNAIGVLTVIFSTTPFEE